MPIDFSPLWISLKTALLATIVTFFAGIGVARWMLGYQGKGKVLLESLLLSPLILPPTVVGFLLLQLLGKHGPLGQVLQALHIQLVFTWYAAVLTATIVSFPLMYKATLGAFQQVDSNLERAARTLGASEGEIFWRISVPLAIPGILAGTALAFARSLGEFGATLMLAGNIPGETQTLPMAIYFAVEAGAMGEAWLWTGVLLMVCLGGILAIHWGQSLGKRRSWHGSGKKNSTSPSSWRDSLEEHYLQVEVEKQLPDFPLSIAFATENASLGILGASGAGKSMLLRLLAGLETADRGRIVLNGRVLYDSQRKINLTPQERGIGIVFQNYALFPHMTIGQNIAFGLPRSLSVAEKRARIQKQLQLFQLETLGDRFPHQLSGGQQQRVAFARAIASEPQALLLDEPFSALDTHLRFQMEKELLTILQNFRGIPLLVTHNIEEAYRICHNLLVLEKGTIVQSGKKQTIFEHPRTPAIAQLTGCKNFSPAQPIDTSHIHAIDWNCTLEVAAPPPRIGHVAIRAHHILFRESSHAPNTFSGWLANTSETPHRMTLYLKLHHPPAHKNDYHLQAEVYKDRWQTLKDLPQPWSILLAPDRVLLFSE